MADGEDALKVGAALAVLWAGYKLLVPAAAKEEVVPGSTMYIRSVNTDKPVYTKDNQGNYLINISTIVGNADSKDFNGFLGCSIGKGQQWVDAQELVLSVGPNSEITRSFALNITPTPDMPLGVWEAAVSIWKDRTSDDPAVPNRMKGRLADKRVQFTLS